jgi:transposase-like protein
MAIRFAPGRARDEGRRCAVRGHEGPIIEVSNNLIEQDHRNIKSRTKVMLGFKRFRNATTTISGIELMHRIRKGQFNLAALDLKDTATTTVWNSVLSTQ